MRMCGCTTSGNRRLMWIPSAKPFCPLVQLRMRWTHTRLWQQLVGCVSFQMLPLRSILIFYLYQLCVQQHNNSVQPIIGVLGHG